MAFLVFEGLDGSGKSTLIERLVNHLRASGKNLIVTREPGGTRLAEEIRRLILCTDDEAPVARCELLLYEAARAQHVERVIRPALESGQWVLCDRYTASTVAFQSYARGISHAEVDWLNRYAVAGVEPDLWVLLDLPVEVSQSRSRARNQNLGQKDDRMESETTHFHSLVRQGYLEQARRNPSQWLVIDATQAPEKIFADLVAQLEVRGWLER